MTVDMLYQEIKEGDYVCYNPPYIKGLVIGRVVKVTKKSLEIKGLNSTRGQSNRRSADVIRINEQIELARNENPEHFI